MLVDVDLEDRSGLGAQLRRLPDHLGGRVLGHGDGQGRVDQRMCVPAPEVRGSALPIRDDLGQDAPDAGFLGALGHRADVHRSAGPGVGDGGEAAAQRLQRGQFRREIGALLVQRMLQRLPDRLEDLRRLPERLGLAEALGQMVVGVDEARHEQMAVEAHRAERGVPGEEFAGRADLPELPVLHEYRVVPDRPVRQHQHLRHEQLLRAAELLRPRGVRRLAYARPGRRRRGGRGGRGPAGTAGHGGAEQSARAGQPHPDEKSAPPDAAAALARRLAPGSRLRSPVPSLRRCMTRFLTRRTRILPRFMLRPRPRRLPRARQRLLVRALARRLRRVPPLVVRHLLVVPFVRQPARLLPYLRPSH